MRGNGRKRGPERRRGGRRSGPATAAGTAAKYYRGRRAPSTGLFVSTAAKLGDESELFKDLEE
jgi:hypothetical protein